MPFSGPREKGQSASHKDLRVLTLVGQTMALTRSKNGLITENHKGWYRGKPGPQDSSAWSSRSPYWVLQMWEGNGEGKDNTPNRKQLSWGLPSRESSKRNRITPLVSIHPLFSLGVRGHRPNCFPASWVQRSLDFLAGQACALKLHVAQVWGLQLMGPGRHSAEARSHRLKTQPLSLATSLHYSSFLFSWGHQLNPS